MLHVAEEKIIRRLFSKTDFSYCLLPQNLFRPPLYKDRNFNLFIGLFDRDQNLVFNEKKIPIQFALYSCDDEIEPILLNKQNQPIVKGKTIVDLSSGFASFIKLSIR